MYDIMPYPKIKTMYARDNKTFKVIEGDWKAPEFAMLSGMQWVFTEKIHGMNVRIHFDAERNEVIYGGRGPKAVIPKPLLEYLTEEYGPARFTEAGIQHSMTLYGEGFGLGIQDQGKNYNPDGVSFVLFDVRCGNHWLSWDNIGNVAHTLGVPVVKCYGSGDLQDLEGFVRAGILSAYGPQVSVEGIVARPHIELNNRHGERIMLKLKGNDFAKETDNVDTTTG